PGQEQLNMDLLCGSNAARRLKDISRTSEEVLEILGNDLVLDRMTEGIELFSRPRAAEDILEIITRYK
ncbi:MAG TPA: hypothetical protein DCM41_03410, partial [Synergistaceae bacterium]|nr:hypothetical protein [Synergistaceae bacterium]